MHKAWMLALLGVSPLVHAAPADDDATCRNGLFTSAPVAFSLGKVIPPRLYLLKDTDGCPDTGGAACQGRAYVVKNDIVLTAQRRNAYVCVLYPNKGGGNAGWVAQSSLQMQPSAATPTAQAWNGHWHDGDNTLQLTTNADGSITVNGDAYWPSAFPDPEQTPGGPHTGSVTARGYPEGNRVEVNEDMCKVRLQLLGDMLLADDNLECGGMNVSFGGVYRKK
ncbi:hypothetical protein XaraCFBP7407_17200 [Xanthomonas arboricola pv. arracaciae]|uniref:hypothetical protein n=1 Tax=Xanthomonas arboricola TaxID=56448 RepID=UPI000CEED41D|nr:hypothetical protein [Xanthomonas arboricola]PPT93699.1 hypothetical protein XaraCFBP7407_17200 [Xanthomonas arboricola pv. arracaciae]